MISIAKKFSMTGELRMCVMAQTVEHVLNKNLNEKN